MVDNNVRRNTKKMEIKHEKKVLMFSDFVDIKFLKAKREKERREKKMLFIVSIFGFWQLCKV